MGLFIKKPLEALQAEANQTGSKSLKRVLGPYLVLSLLFETNRLFVT